MRWKDMTFVQQLSEYNLKQTDEVFFDKKKDKRHNKRFFGIKINMHPVNNRAELVVKLKYN